MEEDEENQRQSIPHYRQVCFPKLIALVIEHCHSLKHLISVTTFHEFPKLELMIIKEASQLDGMFRNEQGNEFPQLKLRLPKLKYLVLMQLLNLADLSQQMELQNVTYSVVHHCPKLSFASTTTLEDLKNILEDSNIDRDVHWEIFEITETIMEETEYENPMTETIPQLPIVQEVQNVQVQSAPERELPCLQIIDEADKEIVAIHDSEMATSSTDLEVITTPFPSPSAIHQYETPQEMVDEQVVSERSLMDQQDALTEANFKMEIARETVVPLPYNSTKETVEQSLLKCPDAEKAITTIWSTNSEPRNPSPGPSLIPIQNTFPRSIEGSVQGVPTSDETKISPQLVEKLSMDEVQIPMEQITIRENKSFNGTPQTTDEPSNLTQNVKSSTNGSVSEAELNKTALAAPSTLPELDGSAVALMGDLLNETSSMISPNPEINLTSSPSVSMQRMSRSLLVEELFNNNAKVHSFSPDTEKSSSLILEAKPLPELKTELAEYLNMSLEAIIDTNVFDNVERIVDSLARESTDVFQQNILKDFKSRLKTFKESVPKAVTTLQSSSEFMSNYENLDMELNDKLNEGQAKIEDLETKLSETLAKEYTIEMEIQQLINQKSEILAQKDFLTSQLDKYTQVVSRDYAQWKASGEEAILCTDRWLKSKEDLAHANASWKIFKEILRL